MWPRICLLALGTFAIGTDGFIVAGVLRQISAELGVGVPAAGQLVTVFAAVYAIASPMLASVTAKLPRRTLLLLALALFGLGNALAALATSYAALLAARVIAAIASAAYTPCAAVAAATLAGPRHRGKALALVMGGITVATLAGVPIGTWLGDSGGFRAAFWWVTAVGVLALAGLALWLPALPPVATAGVAARLRSLRLPGVPGTLAVTLLAMTAGFTVYTYIGPLLAERLHAGPRTLSLVLVVFGLAGTIGNLGSGWLADAWGPGRTVSLSLAGVMAAMAVLPLATRTLPGTLLAIFLWNAAGWLLLPAQQHRLLSGRPETGQLLLSLNASAMYLGIGLAGSLGGWVIHLAGVQALGPAAAVIAALALALHLASARPGAQAMPAQTAAQPPSDG